MDAAVIHWLRRRFVTGFFVMVPLIISLLAVIWVFGIVHGLLIGLCGASATFAPLIADGATSGGWATSPRRPTGTSTTRPVVLTWSPSLICV